MRTDDCEGNELAYLDTAAEDAAAEADALIRAAYAARIAANQSAWATIRRTLRRLWPAR